MYMYKEDLVVNNLQRLICHKSKANETLSNTWPKHVLPLWVRLYLRIMAWNLIWWWGFGSGALMSVEYSFIAIFPQVDSGPKWYYLSSFQRNDYQQI